MIKILNRSVRASVVGIIRAQMAVGATGDFLHFDPPAASESGASPPWSDGATSASSGRCAGTCSTSTTSPAEAGVSDLQHEGWRGSSNATDAASGVPSLELLPAALGPGRACRGAARARPVRRERAACHVRCCEECVSRC